jgi:ComF family protein
MSVSHHAVRVKKLLDLLLPPTCPGCGSEGQILCATCRKQLARRRDEPAGVPLGLPSRQPAGVVQMEWCAAYSGPARSCLHALKYDGELRIVAPLAELMAERWVRAGVGGDLLVPVPVHAARKRQRGFDQAELLARAIGEILKLPVVPAVQRASKTTAQHHLGRSARAMNVGHAFAPRPGAAARVEGAWAILVDDLTTTGATFAGCAAVLYDAGASAVSGLALARER